MKYRADIDGMRAIAVTIVLFYHARLGFPGGYVGVDVFFVISGYLITSLLVKALATGTFSYLEFWERRTRRLLPALAVVTLFTAICSYFILLPEDLIDLGGALIAQPILLANVYFWRTVQGGYFGDAPEIRPLLHTWSLGVEEQFYIFFPLFLVLIFKWAVMRAKLARILAALTLLSFSLAVVLTPVKGVFSFFTLPTRAWELLMGGLLAFLPPTVIGRRICEGAGWLGLGLIAYATFCFDDHTPFPGLAALIPCVGASLLIVANSDVSSPTTLGAALSHPALVRIGAISYSLYLWHWPLMAFAFYVGIAQSIESRLTLVIASGWLGYLSWRWIENPFREKRFLGNRRSILTFFVLYALVSLGLGAYFCAGYGFPNNWSNEAVSYISSGKDRSALLATNIEAEHLPTIGSADKSSFLVWGDSHAMALIPVLSRLGRLYGLKGVVLTDSSRAPLKSWDYAISTGFTCDRSKDRAWAERAIDTVRRERLKTVFLIAYWRKYAGSQFSEQLAETVLALENEGAEVVFVGDVPLQTGTSPPRDLAQATKWNLRRTEPATAASHRENNEVVYNALRGQTQSLQIIDPAPLILSWAQLGFRGLSYYADDNHLTDHGALHLKPLFEPIFKDMNAAHSATSLR